MIAYLNCCNTAHTTTSQNLQEWMIMGATYFILLGENAICGIIMPHFVRVFSLVYKLSITILAVLM